MNAYSKRVQKSGKSDVSGRPAQPPKCPECGSERVWKAGLRYTTFGQIQRYICRECGYRFSESSHINKNSEAYSIDRRVCVSDNEMENLAKVETRTENRLAGATDAETKVRSKLFEFAWYMKKQGYQQSTINKYQTVLKTVAKQQCNIFDSESVKEAIAKQDTWCTNTKHLVVNIYTTFLTFLGKNWNKPRYKEITKLPFIPEETEINQLIAACSRKLGTFLQLLKETGMRPGEAWSLKWFNIDTKRKTVTINNPEKGSNSRILNISTQLASRLDLLQKNAEYVFRKNPKQQLKNWTINFAARRKVIAKKLNNPRLLKITFKTLRHYKGTVLYHKTKDILHVKETLGHKDINNTLVYVHLESAIFKTGSDSFTVKTAKTVAEAEKLLEVGFDYVTEIDNVKLFRKLK